MKTLTGISVAQGIVQGKVCVYSNLSNESLPHYSIPKKHLEKELKRLALAFETANLRINEILEVSKDLLGNQGKEIISAHLSILNDKGLRKKIENQIIEQYNNAEHAVSDIFDNYVQKLSQQGMHFEEISHDIIDVKERLLESMGASSSNFTCPIGEHRPVVVVSAVLTPSMILQIPKEHILAFVTKFGGYTSHATILAKTLDVPVIFGIEHIEELTCNCEVVVDGYLGKVFIDPDQKTKEFYKKRLQLHNNRQHFCSIKRQVPAQTASGERIKLKVNISTLGETELLKDFGDLPGSFPIHYDGIGLLRTEFIFMKGTAPPTETEQVSVYKNILSVANGKPVVMRMLDLSPDKQPPYMQSLSPELQDVRGTLAIDTFKNLYLTQARAMLRAAVGAKLKILFPMVADLDDVYIVKQLIKEAAASLKKDSLEYQVPELGIMFETPSSVMLAEDLLNKVDFANIGTNDLLQYSVAASRDSLLYQTKYHIMHPSVVKMLDHISQAGAKLGKEICLCGELGSFEQYYPVLLDIGLKSFSVQSSKYEAIKCELLHIGQKDYKGYYLKYMKQRRKITQQSFFDSITEKNASDN